MDDNTNPQDSFQDALVAEMAGEEPTTAVATTGSDEAAPEAKKDDEDSKVETAEESANKDAEDAAAESADGADAEATTEDETEEDPKFATKQDVIDAMREYNKETTERANQLDTVKKEIIEKAYPEGIDTNIYDTDGNVIKTAQDIVDRELINERTGEPFTYDEAASFMLQAGQKMAENMKELQDWADNVAEKNISLLDSNERVMSQWGDVLEAMPALAKQLAEKYVTTQLEFDPTNSYITRMTMTPEDFYTLTLSPYKQLGEAMAAKEAETASTQETEAVNEQSERMGLPPQRGESHMKSNTGDAMLDALIDEMNKG